MRMLGEQQQMLRVRDVVPGYGFVVGRRRCHIGEAMDQLMV